MDVWLLRKVCVGWWVAQQNRVTPSLSPLELDFGLGLWTWTWIVTKLITWTLGSTRQQLTKSKYDSSLILQNHLIDNTVSDETKYFYSRIYLQQNTEGEGEGDDYKEPGNTKEKPTKETKTVVGPLLQRAA